MGLTDKFRINELTKKGSKVERRTSAGNILVKKVDGKQVRPTNNKSKKPFGQEVIKGKNIDTKFKFELNESDDTPNIEQTSFSGESTGYVEKPKYNESELKKAVDVKVDELIKQKKSKRGPYILKSKFDDLRKKYEDALAQIADLRKKLNNALAEISRLEGVIQQLEVEADSAKLQQAAAENQLQAANDRYITLLSDFQQAIIKGTKEAIERVSLEAQVRGLQAQKETLVRIEEQEDAQQETAAILASLTGVPNSFEQKGDYAWKLPQAAIKDQAELEGYTFYFRSNRKSSGWLNGNTIELYNFTEDSEVTYSFDITKGSTGGHGSPWFGFSPMSGTIPARSGSTPGKVTVDANKIRNVNSPRGRRKVFDDKIVLTIADATFDMTARFYRKLRTGGHGN
jgi:hypothetical protein